MSHKFGISLFYQELLIKIDLLSTSSALSNSRISHIISIITDVQSFSDMMFRKIKGIQGILFKLYQAIYDYKKKSYQLL